MAGNRTNDIKVHCSFCGKSQDEVRKSLQAMVYSSRNECDIVPKQQQK